MVVYRAPKPASTDATTGVRRTMTLVVTTQDSSALSEAQIEEMCTIGGAFGEGAFLKAKEDWVLCTLATVDGKVHGVTFRPSNGSAGHPVS